MRRQKRGKARTFTVECKAVARMSDIHDAFGATDPAHRRRRVGCGRKARGKSRNFTRKCGFFDRPARRAERVMRAAMMDVGEQRFLMLLLWWSAGLDQWLNGRRQAGEQSRPPNV